MIIFKRANDLSGWLKRERHAAKSIGFVPTMGALHAGHISLITISKSKADWTVCSIFVNPTQFNDPKDYQKYPVTLENDIAMLEAAGVDILFLPAAAELYPTGTTDLEHYDLGTLETLLEGKFRPGHFQGVCQVMNRLLTIVRPHYLLMGQKDYQQCMVVRRLLTLMELDTTLIPCPIVRESDGLAMSSRNLRLDPVERANAAAIYRALLLLHKEFHIGSATALATADTMLKQANFKIDYISVANSTTLEPVSDRTAGHPIIALIAAFQGEVRLIDNMIL